jgi:hypothetical protein
VSIAALIDTVAWSLADMKPPVVERKWPPRGN